jgi:hypothetical protein
MYSYHISNMKEREGPVMFEKAKEDPFGLDDFLEEAKKGPKRGLQRATNEADIDEEDSKRRRY